MKKEKIINFITTKLNFKIQKKIKSKLPICYESADKNIIGLKACLNGEFIEKYFDCETKEEIFSPEKNKVVYASYNAERKGYEVSVAFPILYNNKGYVFIYTKDNVLYATYLHHRKNYFFPCESAIPDNKSLKHVQIDEEKVEYTSPFTYHDSESKKTVFLLNIPEEENRDPFVATDEWELLVDYHEMLNSIEAFRKEKMYFIIPSSNKKETNKILKNKTLSEFLIKNLKK